ncbi:glyoxalase [Yimella sp. cx-573]|nr:glyoxalase [Yimella sp. cx-573]
MHRMIFVNLPVADLDRSRAFFTGLGYSFNEKFCDGNALALGLGENIFAMLLQTDFYATFHDKQTIDAREGSECLLCVSADSREQVDSLVDSAVAAGGREGRTQDHGFMYGRSYDDLDGHTWEIMWMDQQAADMGPEAYAAQNA